MEITLDSSRESPRHDRYETWILLSFYQLPDLWDDRTKDDKGVAHSCTDPKFPILRYREDVEASGKVKSVAQSEQLQSVFFFT